MQVLVVLSLVRRGRDDGRSSCGCSVRKMCLVPKILLPAHVGCFLALSSTVGLCSGGSCVLNSLPRGLQ